MSHEPPTVSLDRQFGLLQATALNVTMIVGAGVFAMIPLMVKELPGPYALLGWVAAGVLMLIDGMIWSELAATLPGSGGSYLYLLECYGRNGWGKLMAFLFIWQFLISGPLELASGLIAIAQFSNELHPAFKEFNLRWTWEYAPLAISTSPAKLLAFGLGLLILVLLYRRMTVLGRLTVTFWLGVLAVIAWIIIDGLLHFDSGKAWDFSGAVEARKSSLAGGLGATMILAMYSYFGYYNVCYIGDEVRDPGRTMPRAILLSSLLVFALFLALHVAMMGVVSWKEIPTEQAQLDTFSLPATFMSRLHGSWASTLVTVLLIWSCFGSVFAALLGYSRIPYGAAMQGHFFSALGKIHERHRIPHVSLILVGALTLFWSFFSMQGVIEALTTTRILEQFVGQCIGVMILRRSQPNRARPYRIWLYPLPCLLALAGWIFVYLSAPIEFILLGFATLFVGAIVYAVWTRWR